MSFLFKSIVVVCVGIIVCVTGFEYKLMQNAPFLANGRINAYEISEISQHAMHSVVFAVKLRNVDQMKALLDDISDPSSPQYAKYLSRQEIADISANPQSTETIVNFLRSVDGMATVEPTPYGDLIKAVAPISTWETVFNSKYQHFHREGITHLATRELYLPSEIADLVVTVYGTTQGFASPRPKPVPEIPRQYIEGALQGASATDDPYPFLFVTPAVLNSLYHITSNNGNNYGSQAVFESINESYSVSDLTQFQTMNNLPLQQPSTIIGGHVIQGPCGGGFSNCGEANLDIQFLMGIAQSVPTTYWYNDSLETWLLTLASQTDPPLVNSISYLYAELHITVADADAFDTEAVIFSLMGLTLLGASGDGGAPGQFVNSVPSNCGYMPSWPQTSPYVTAVGATQNDPEVVCSSGSEGTITSGGGFSNIYPTASFQTEVVKNYLLTARTPFQNYSNSNIPNVNRFFNASGRAYPDISLQGAYYIIVIDGNATGVAGTSASTPSFAGMVSLVNSGRIAAGLGPVGWLNPALYKYANQFVNDITEGNNTCMEFESLSDPIVCCQEGFFAAAGWDATTGLGTVNFASFYDVMVTQFIATPTAGPTTHHNSKTGKYFGIACAIFLFGVAVFTFVYNFSAIKLLCGLSSTVTSGIPQQNPLTSPQVRSNEIAVHSDF